MTRFDTKKTQYYSKYTKNIHSKTNISSLETHVAISTEEILDSALEKLIYSPKHSLKESILKKKSHTNSNNQTIMNSNVKKINSNNIQVKLKKQNHININTNPKLIIANTNCLGFDRYAATIKKNNSTQLKKERLENNYKFNLRSTQFKHLAENIKTVNTSSIKPIGLIQHPQRSSRNFNSTINLVTQQINQFRHMQPGQLQSLITHNTKSIGLNLLKNTYNTVGSIASSNLVYISAYALVASTPFIMFYFPTSIPIAIPIYTTSLFYLEYMTIEGFQKWE